MNTHQEIDNALCGDVVELRQGFARISLATQGRMRVDETGLVHGGFIFGLADYAAMLAVNHPNVVLGAAEVKFLKPVKAGDVAVAEATVESSQGKKSLVEVVVTVADTDVFKGVFTCFILDTHVLK